MENRKGPYDRDLELFRLLLCQVRVTAGLRQQDLAVRLGEPQSWVSKVESGERRIDVVELRRLCQALGVSLVDFVERLEASLADSVSSTET